MRERIKDWRKYFIWAAIAAGCILVDTGFFLVLGSALKWLAGFASPAIWAALAVVGIVAARIVRLLDESRYPRRQAPPQGHPG